jgi:hypothetical protein
MSFILLKIGKETHRQIGKQTRDKHKQETNRQETNRQEANRQETNRQEANRQETSIQTDKLTNRQINRQTEEKGHRDAAIFSVTFSVFVFFVA